MLCGADRIIPDIAVPLRSARYQDGDLADPAALCVEILSPGQTLSSLFDKAERILRAGTPVCWVIWPERRQAWHYRKDRLAEAKEELVIDLADGECIRIGLAELWAELDRRFPPRLRPQLKATKQTQRKPIRTFRPCILVSSKAKHSSLSKRAPP